MVDTYINKLALHAFPVNLDQEHVENTTHEK